MYAEEKQFWTEFLELYESMPSLWKVKSSEYCNRKLKNQCYNQLVEKLKEIDPEANREKVVKKINVFRTNYKRDLRKIINSEISGGGIYRPTLWYFEKLQFLDDPESARVEDHIIDETESFKIEVITPPPKKVRKTVTQQSVSLPLQTNISPHTNISQSQSQFNNEYYTIALTWANELRKLEPRQQLYAKKAINQILYEGQLGTLDRNSIQINTTVETYDPLDEHEETSDQYFVPDQKVKKRKWMNECFQKRDEFTYEKFLKELQDCDSNDFRNCFRADVTIFDELLKMVAPLIEKKNTMMRDAISPSQRLSITLRYLATGESFEELKDSYAISSQCIGKMVVETCQALNDCLKDCIKTPENEEEWNAVADGFNYKWNFPNCLGAVDGKHLAIKKPPNSGSDFYNYKKFFSIVLLAVVNSNYEFIMVDAGINGGISDGDVLHHSNLGKALEDNTLNIPGDSALPYSDKELPFVFVGNDTFVLSEHIMKPYNTTDLSLDKRIFNYRLNRASNIVENAMGILFARFGVLQRTIALSPQKAQIIVLACCHLHNYLRINPNYMSQESVDWEEMETSQIVEGSWRAESNATSLGACYSINSTANAKMIRDLYCNYFNNEGYIEQQNNVV